MKGAYNCSRTVCGQAYIHHFLLTWPGWQIKFAKLLATDEAKCILVLSSQRTQKGL